MSVVRRLLIAAGIVGLGVTVWLIGEIQSDRRADETLCAIERITNTAYECTVTSYGPAIFAGVLSVAAIVVGSRWPPRRVGSTPNP